MTLHKRLTKLEAKRFQLQTGPRIIIHDIVWRSDGGGVQSIGAFAKVLTASGWKTITRETDEPEAEFHLRAVAMSALTIHSTNQRQQIKMLQDFQFACAAKPFRAMPQELL